MRQFSKQISAFIPAEQMLDVQIHQIMKSKEEFEALKQQRDTRQQRQPAERSACLMVSCPSTCLQGEPASAFELQECNAELLLGTLDLYAVKAMPGEVLIGEKSALRCPVMACRWSSTTLISYCHFSHRNELTNDTI